MGRVVQADDIMLHLDNVKGEIQEMVAKNEFDYLRFTLDGLVSKLQKGGSKNYDDTAINRLGDFTVLLPDDMAFAMLKDLTSEADICERLYLKRDDIFAILKRVRANG